MINSFFTVVCEVDNKLCEQDIKKVKFKLIKHIELRERPPRSINQQIEEPVYTQREVIAKVMSPLVKSGTTDARQFSIPMSQLMQCTANMKTEEYKKCLFDVSLKESRYLLDFFPPTVTSQLITVEYTFQIYIDFKGMNLSGKKPVEEISLQFQCARDGGLLWRHQEDMKRPSLKNWSPMRNKNTDIDWTIKPANVRLLILHPHGYEQLGSTEVKLLNSKSIASSEHSKGRSSKQARNPISRQI